MNITEGQLALLRNYNVRISDEINDLLLELDAKITAIGFDKNYDLNEDGLKLQLLYDALYDQN